jgi:hypothetical protein
MIGRIREFIEDLLFPELRPFDRQERDRLMRNAVKGAPYFP